MHRINGIETDEKRRSNGTDHFVNSVTCNSAAPAALDRYLAAVPAMSRFPNAPFCLKIGIVS